MRVESDWKHELIRTAATAAAVADGPDAVAFAAAMSHLKGLMRDGVPGALHPSSEAAVTAMSANVEDFGVVTGRMLAAAVRMIDEADGQMARDAIVAASGVEHIRLPSSFSSAWPVGHESDSYEPWEEVIDGWSAFQTAIFELTQRHPSRDLVWRGARRAEWGVKSSLYRALEGEAGRPPLEDELNTAESRVLDLARKDWRFDDRGALEMLAHLQHYGAPTRLLDVTINPLIALWFAVEARPEDDDADARVFAFVTNYRPITLNSRWGGRYLPWHEFGDDDRRRAHEWGTGRRRRIWRPPAYNERIASQNAAFLIDGAPIAANHERSVGRSQPTLEELRRLASINLRFSNVRRESLRQESAPVFTFRVLGGAKVEIRQQLEQRFGYRASSIYSDLNGLADYIRDHPSLLVDEAGDESS